MRHIERFAKPRILVEKEKEWLDEFISSRRSRPQSSKYAHPDIRSALMNMSHNKCFYSESILKNKPSEVDHLIEVSKDKTKAFEWENLYLACKECNNGRPDYDTIPTDQVLDPCKDSDEEIRRHITFNREQITAVAGSEKGFKTIQKFKLSSADLDLQRSKQLNKLATLIVQIMMEMNQDRRDMNREEKETLKSFTYPDRPFSLMAEIYLRQNCPVVFMD